MQSVFVIFFMSVLPLSICDLCKICDCSKSDNSVEYDCAGKLDPSNGDLNLFLLIENSPNKLILSNNWLNETSLGHIKKLVSLESLDISHNRITEINREILDRLIELKKFDVSWNVIKNLKFEIFGKNEKLENVNLSNNKISAIDFSLENPLTTIVTLNLANNFITNLGENFTANFPNLLSLDLSNNLFEKFIFEHSISPNFHLKFLNLEHNTMNLINLQTHVQELRIGYNKLKSLPQNLSVETLSIENNELREIGYDENLFAKLRYLNLSGNRIKQVGSLKWPLLRELDISNNAFMSIPEELTSQNLPNLETLVVNGNPIKELKFSNKLNLRKFVMRNTSLLNAIYEDAFENLMEIGANCINITISGNKNLNRFDEAAIRRMNICYLDLSENGFTKISDKLEKVLNGTMPKYGINLQGNPFICNCQAEWMLAQLVPKLYLLNPELLAELKCAGPPKLLGMRMVHWLKWKGQVFCDDVTENDFSRLELFEGTQDFIRRRQTISLKSGSGMLIVVICAGIALLLLVITGLVMSYKLALRRRRSNRRF